MSDATNPAMDQRDLLDKDAPPCPKHAFFGPERGSIWGWDVTCEHCGMNRLDWVADEAVRMERAEASDRPYNGAMDALAKLKRPRGN